MADGQRITRSRMDYPFVAGLVYVACPKNGALVVRTIDDLLEVFAPGTWAWARRTG